MGGWSVLTAEAEAGLVLWISFPLHGLSVRVLGSSMAFAQSLGSGGRAHPSGDLSGHWKRTMSFVLGGCQRS